MLIVRRGEWQQGDAARPLDRGREQSLMMSAVTGDAARCHLAALGDEL